MLCEMAWPLKIFSGTTPMCLRPCFGCLFFFLHPWDNWWTLTSIWPIICNLFSAFSDIWIASLSAIVVNRCLEEKSNHLLVRSGENLNLLSLAPSTSCDSTPWTSYSHSPPSLRLSLPQRWLSTFSSSPSTMTAKPSSSQSCSYGAPTLSLKKKSVLAFDPMNLEVVLCFHVCFTLSFSSSYSCSCESSDQTVYFDS